MPTVFEVQYPNGYVKPRIKTVDRNLFSAQVTQPGWTNEVVVQEVNPFVSWVLGDKVTIIDSAPFDLQLLRLMVTHKEGEASDHPQEEYHLFTGDVGFEQWFSTVSMGVDKIQIVPAQGQYVSEGTRVSVALTRALTSRDSAVRLEYCEYKTE